MMLRMPKLLTPNNNFYEYAPNAFMYSSKLSLLSIFHFPIMISVMFALHFITTPLSQAGHYGAPAHASRRRKFALVISV